MHFSPDTIIKVRISQEGMRYTLGSAVIDKLLINTNLKLNT